MSPTRQSPWIVTERVLWSGAQLNMKTVSVRMWKPVSWELLDLSVLLRKPRPHVPACTPVPQARPWARALSPVLDPGGPHSLAPTAWVPGNLLDYAHVFTSLYSKRPLLILAALCEPERAGNWASHTPSQPEPPTAAEGRGLCTSDSRMKMKPAGIPKVTVVGQLTCAWCPARLPRGPRTAPATPTHFYAVRGQGGNLGNDHTLKRMRTNVRKIVRRGSTAKGSSQRYMLSLNMRPQNKT